MLITILSKLITNILTRPLMGISISISLCFDCKPVMSVFFQIDLKPSTHLPNLWDDEPSFQQLCWDFNFFKLTKLPVVDFLHQSKEVLLSLNITTSLEELISLQKEIWLDSIQSVFS